MTGIGAKRGNAKEALLPWVIGLAVCATFGVIGPWFMRLLGGLGGGLFDTKL